MVSYNFFKLLFLIGYLSFYIILITADPVREIMKKRIKCVGDIKNAFHGSSETDEILKKSILYMTNSSSVFTKIPDSFEYYKTFKQFVVPGNLMDLPITFCEKRYDPSSGQFKMCLELLQSFGSGSKEDILLKAFYEIRTKDFRFPWEICGVNYLTHIYNSCVLLSTMPTLAQFCSTRYDIELPNDLYIEYSKQQK